MSDVRCNACGREGMPEEDGTCYFCGSADVDWPGDEDPEGQDQADYTADQ